MRRRKYGINSEHLSGNGYSSQQYRDARHQHQRQSGDGYAERIPDANI
jgi:hypothetical protein